MKTDWLSKFLKRLGLQQAVEEQATPTPDPDALKEMVRSILSTRPDEIGCDECFEQVDRFAEMVLDGRPAAEALPLVQDHLNRCDDCREEFEALLIALDAMA